MTQQKIKPTDPIISVVLTTHREGILLHKTILSLLKSAKHLEYEKIRYEFIINLDNSDPATLKYIERWCEDDRFVLTKVSFGNPADNRNDAIKRASGKYIALMDGDDLISENWLLSAYKLLEKQKQPTVLRPAAHAQFGYEDPSVTVWFMRDSSTKEVDAVQMSYWNLWTNALFTHKEILINNPYKASLNGFGFEDFLLNADMRAKEIAQVTVPETVLWYRHRAGSISTEHLGTVLDYTDLFDVDYMKSISTEDSDKPKKMSLSYRARSTGVRLYRFAYDAARKIGPIERTIAPTAREILYKKKLKKTPSWFIQRWEEINSIENQLWPTRGEIAKLKFHPLSNNPLHNELGAIYQKLCQSITNNTIDYLFLAPEMSGRGGTEKLISNYIKALQKTHPRWNIAILSTQAYNEATIDYFTSIGVDMLDFGSLMAGRSVYERDIVWSRILIQSKVKRLHVVNDAFWYHWLARHEKLMIQNDYKVYISLFMREYVHEPNRIQSFADPDLVQIWPSVTKVFTDNQRVINDALGNNAFEKDKMITHYQPQDIKSVVRPKVIDPDKPIRVLWASRVSHQKRPDILKKVAEMLSDNYTVDAYGIIEKRQYNQNYFSNSKVNYMGPFSGMHTIPTDTYDIYLYTSQTDGVPNILMEVAAVGLPIVASNIGGVSEFIKTGQTGALVEMEDIQAYVNAIESMVQHPASTEKMVLNSQKLLLSQHSWDEFIDKIAKDIS